MSSGPALLPLNFGQFRAPTCASTLLGGLGPLDRGWTWRGRDITPSALGGPCRSPVWWPSFAHFLGAFLGHAQLCDPMDFVACQAPLSMRFSRQELWSGLPCPSQGSPDPCLSCLLHWQVGSIPLVPPGAYFLGEDIDAFRVREAPGNRPCRRDSGLYLASSSAVRGSMDNWDPCSCPKGQEGLEAIWTPVVPDLSLSRRPLPLERVMRWEPLGQAAWGRAKTLGGVFVSSTGFGEACTCGRCGWVGQGPRLWRRGRDYC